MGLNFSGNVGTKNIDPRIRIDRPTHSLGPTHTVCRSCSISRCLAPERLENQAPGEIRRSSAGRRDTTFCRSAVDF